MLVASGAFCAIANCDALATVQANARPRVKAFEVLMMLDVMKALEREFILLSLQTRPHESSGT